MLPTCSTKGYLSALGLLIGAILTLFPAPARGDHIDLNLNAIGVDRFGGAHDPVRLPAVGNRVGITFYTRAVNVSPAPPPPPVGPPAPRPAINWGFPVKEVKSGGTWVDRNDYTGPPEIAGHAHDTILPTATTAGHEFYGPHPHIQLYCFCQIPGSTGLNGLVLLGASDLKHTFSTAAPDPARHYLIPDEVDDYSEGANKDQSFFGPVSEINPSTFVLADHDHFGKRVMVPDPADPTKRIPLTENGFNVWERNHGAGTKVPGDAEAPPDHADALEHLLQVHPDNIDPAKAAPGTKWFLAASYFVVHDNTAASLMNNTFYREFNPATMKWVGAGRHGPFLAPRPLWIAAAGACPEPSTFALMGTALVALLAWVRHGRKRSAVARQSPGK